MRTYEIYKVKEMYQPFVIGRERLLYDLLTENPENSKNLPEVHYLCEVLERQAINEAILNNLGKLFPIVEFENNEYKLTHPVKGSISISLSSYALNVYCDGSRMLDLDLFVALSESGNRFFAVMDGYGEWGWLKPVKYMKMRGQQEALFR